MDRDEIFRSTSEQINEILIEAKGDIFTDPEKTILYANTALITARENKMHEQEFECLLLLADSHKRLKHYKEALDCAERAEAFAGSHNIPRQAEALILKGDIKRSGGDHRQALDDYQRALEISRETDRDSKVEGSLLQNIASLFYTLNDHKSSIKHYTELLDWSEKHSDKLLTASTLINLGNLLNKSSSYDQALDYFLRSLTIYQDLENLDGMIYTQINLGLLYWRRYQYDRALEYLKEAKTNVSRTVNKDLMYEVLNDLGMIYRNLKQFDEARNCYAEAMKIRDETVESPNAFEENKQTITTGDRLNSLLNLITVYMKLDAKEAAEKAVDEVIIMLDNTDNKELIKDAYKTISDYYHYVNAYTEAYDYYKKYIRLSEEIHAERETIKFANVERDHELKKIEQKVESRLKLAKTSAALAMAITASHEINQPLMVIVGNLELLQESLKDKDISEKQKNYMQNIKLSVERVTRILEKFQTTKDVQFQDYTKPADEIVVFDEDDKQ